MRPSVKLAGSQALCHAVHFRILTSLPKQRREELSRPSLSQHRSASASRFWQRLLTQPAFVGEAFQQSQQEYVIPTCCTYAQLIC
jgi:hypothetical protein